MSCRRMTELISVSMDRPLKRREKLMLRIHLLTCGACRRYRQQLDRLRGVVRTSCDMIDDGTAEQSNAELSSDARARIAEALKNK